MDFLFTETIKMLAGATNAPVLVTKTFGGIARQVCENVLPFYQPAGAGGLKNVHDDVVFFNVTYTDDPYNKQVESVYDGNVDNALTTVSMQFTRALRVSWTCCGDNCYEWAERLRIMLFDADVRTDFAAQNISLIPTVNEPEFAPEILGQEWLHRYDLFANFYQSASLVKTQPAVYAARVIIETSEGVEAIC